MMRTFLCGVALLCASCGVSADEVAELRAQVEALESQLQSLQPSSDQANQATLDTMTNLSLCLTDLELSNVGTRAQAATIAEHLQRCGQFGIGTIEGLPVRPDASRERVAQCYEACGWFRGVRRGTDRQRRSVGRGYWQQGYSQCVLGGRRVGGRAATSSQCGSQLREDPENICGACRDEAPNVQQNLGIDPPPGMEEESSEGNTDEATEEAAAEEG